MRAPALLAVCLTLMLSACGFTPMYAPAASGAGAIGPVQVSQIDGKAGHVLKNELDRILSVESSAGGAPPMQLEITLQETISRLGIRLDQSATRAELRLVANYVLTPPNGGQQLRGSVASVVNYDIPTAAFGEITAQDDARERAAEDLAERFRAELALRMAAQRHARHT
jgi:LPS-assembly lipoprotein